MYIASGGDHDVLYVSDVNDALRALSAIYVNTDMSPEEIMSYFRISGLSIKDVVSVYAAFMYRSYGNKVVEYGEKKLALWKEVDDA